MSRHNFPAAIAYKGTQFATREHIREYIRRQLPNLLPCTSTCNCKPDSQLTQGSVETSCRHTTSRTSETFAICKDGHFQACSTPNVFSGRSIRILHAARMATTFNFVAVSYVCGHNNPLYCLLLAKVYIACT